MHLTPSELRPNQWLVLEEGVFAEHAALLLSSEYIAAAEEVLHHAVHLRARNIGDVRRVCLSGRSDGEIN